MFAGIIYDVYQWQQQVFDGSDKTFEMLRRPDTVVTIGVVGDKIIVLRDEQPHRGVRMTFPGGRADNGQEPTLLAAKRELLEETGYEFNDWKLVHVMQKHTKIEWFIYVFVAWNGAQTTQPHLDPGEKIEVSLVPFGTAKEISADSYNAEATKLFEPLTSVEDVLALPEFVGKRVEINTN